MPKRILIAFLFCLIAGSDLAIAHPGHFSVSEIEWNADSQRFEVAMRLRLADLEDAIALQEGTRTSFENSAKAEPLVRKYLADKFLIVFEGDTDCRLHWVGMQLELHDVWIYFEAESFGDAPPKDAPMSTGAIGISANEKWESVLGASRAPHKAGSARDLRSVNIRNSALMKIQPEQTNVVTLRQSSRTESATLSKSAPSAMLFSDETKTPSVLNFLTPQVSGSEARSEPR